MVTANAIEYMTQDLFKGKSPASAARYFAKKFNGQTNIFIASGVINWTPKELEEALYVDKARVVIKGMASMKQGKEHYALDGDASRFNMDRARLKREVVALLGHDPFIGDV